MNGGAGRWMTWWLFHRHPPGQSRQGGEGLPRGLLSVLGIQGPRAVTPLPSPMED